MDISEAAPDFVARAKEAWAQGAWVVAPTESSYALVARASDTVAVARLAQAKGRAGVHPMPVVVKDAAAAREVATIPAALLPLSCLWPAPLTLGLRPKAPFPPQICAADGTIGLRVSAHPILTQLAAAAQGPITVTSANLTGQAPAQCVADVAPCLMPDGCAVIDAGALEKAAPSTVVVSVPEGIDIVRLGAVPKEVVDAIVRPLCSWSHDTLWQGRLKLAQPARGHGYRFNLDPILLAAFIREHVAADVHLLELGAGCGVLSLWLHGSGHLARGVLVERQGAMASIIAHNLLANNASTRLQLVYGDLRTFRRQSQISLVAFNPPYFTEHEGRPSPDVGRDQGRRECFGTLADFVACAAGALGTGGQLATIVALSRLADLRAAFGQFGIAMTHMQEVVARQGERAGRVLVLGERAVSALPPKILPQLVTHTENSRTLTQKVLPWVDGLP